MFFWLGHDSTLQKVLGAIISIRMDMIQLVLLLNFNLNFSSWCIRVDMRLFEREMVLILKPSKLSYYELQLDLLVSICWSWHIESFKRRALICHIHGYEKVVFRHVTTPNLTQNIWTSDSDWFRSDSDRLRSLSQFPWTSATLRCLPETLIISNWKSDGSHLQDESK